LASQDPISQGGRRRVPRARGDRRRRPRQAEEHGAAEHRRRYGV